MHKTFAGSVALALTIIAGTAFADPIVIRFSHVVAENTPKGQAALRFQSLVEQRLPGAVKVEVYPNSMLMDDDAVVEGLLQNTVQIAAPSLSKLEDYSNAYRVFDLPFLLQSTEAVDRFEKSHHGQELLAAMEPKGIMGLCFLHNGMKQMSADRPLRLPVDARGLKFRIQPSSVLQAQFEALGAIPVKAPFGKVYHLLATGTINGQENTWSNMFSQTFYTVQPYITETNHGSLEYMLITSHTFWDGLPANVRDTLSASAREACDHGNAVAAEINQADRKRIAQSGQSQILELSPDERQAWVEAMQPVWRQFESEIGAEMLEAAQAANQTS